MKSITLKNEYGETIEVKRGLNGGIEIRHSDIDRENFGEYHEIGKTVRDPGVAALMNMLGEKQAAFAIGAYMILNGKSFIVNSQEAMMIRDAIKKLE